MEQPMLFADPPPPAGPALALSLTYAGQPVRMVGTADRPEWVAGDVCRVLDIAHAASALRDFDADERGVQPLHTPGGRQLVMTVTEAGLYRLAFRSDKPAARPFQRWVMHDVLPSIRRHGCYPPPAPDAGRPLAIGEAIAPMTALIPLAAVPSITWLPSRPSVDTVYDWHRHGRRGVYLDTIRSGGRLWTTPASVFIFLSRIAGPNPRPADAPVTLTLSVGVNAGAVLSAAGL